MKDQEKTKEQLIRELEEKRRRIDEPAGRMPGNQQSRFSFRHIKDIEKLSGIGFWEFDVAGGEIGWSDQVYILYERDPSLGPPTEAEEANYYSPDETSRLHEYARRAIENGQEAEYDFQIKLPSGKAAFMTGIMRIAKDENGRVTKLFGTFQDITERKQAEEELKRHRNRLEQLVAERTQELTSINETLVEDIGKRKRAEEALRESEQKYGRLFNAVPDAIMIFDSDTRRFLDINESAVRLYGYSREEFLELKQSDVSADIEKSDDSIKKTLAGELRTIPVRFHKKKDGTVFPVEISTTSFVIGDRTVLCGVARDITDRKHAEERLSQSLKEKEILLQEVYHRVKNNMQVVASLLNLQKSRIEDVKAKVALEQSQKRVQSMALIHELLYRSESLSNIDLGEYITSLAGGLLDTGGVKLILDANDISLGIDQAIPCGLVINELVTNSIRHAFSNDQLGQITIKALSVEGEIKLEICDNGKGMPEDFDIRNVGTLGLMLVKGLVENQLHGTWEINSTTAGTKHAIRFKKAE